MEQQLAKLEMFVHPMPKHREPSRQGFLSLHRLSRTILWGNANPEAWAVTVMGPLVHLFGNYLLSTYNVPSWVLGAGSRYSHRQNREKKALPSQSLQFLQGEANKEQNNYLIFCVNRREALRRATKLGRETGGEQSCGQFSVGWLGKVFWTRWPLSKDVRMGGSQPRRFWKQVCQEEGTAKSKALSWANASGVWEVAGRLRWVSRLLL